MPLGSSSDAPVISPGPRICQMPRRGRLVRRRRWRLDAGTSRGSEKAAQQLEKYLEAIVMHPVPGTLDRYDPGILEMTQAAVTLGALGPAFLAVDEQGGAGNAAPQLLDLSLGHAVGRVGAH